MGLFSTLSDLFDENSSNSFEKKLTVAIDKVENTLNTTLDQAESGIQQASTAVDKFDTGAHFAEEKVIVMSDTAQKTIDSIEKQS